MAIRPCGFDSRSWYRSLAAMRGFSFLLILFILINIFTNYSVQETKSLTSVAEFHKTFQHTIFPEPEVPNSKKRELRVSLFAEELKELVVGIQNGDKVEIADALFDIRYVLAGTVLEFGLADQFKSLFDEVQHSNLSQASETEEEVQPTLTPYQSQGEEYFL
ncbi:MAG: pyrophosphohydrolase domain-containing protein [Cecembia sp.]